MIIPTIIKRNADRHLIDALESIIEKCPEAAERIMAEMEDLYAKTESGS